MNSIKLEELSELLERVVEIRRHALEVPVHESSIWKVIDDLADLLVYLDDRVREEAENAQDDRTAPF